MEVSLLYIKSRGISAESFYPYEEESLVCDNQKAAVGGTYSIKSYSQLTPAYSCSALETYILNTGTVITGVYVDLKFVKYQSGIFSCATAPNIDHAIVVVGVDPLFFRAQNSWGTGWGESGFIRIVKGPVVTNCNICSFMYVTEVF